MSAHGLRNAALAAARRGWPVFPGHPGSKRPAITDWESRASTDDDRIDQWWRAVPDANPAIATGPAGLVVLDLDDAAHHGHTAAPFRHGGDSLTSAALEAGEWVPTTFTVRTPNDGRHLYFAAPSGTRLGNTQSRIGPLIDTRGHGGYVLTIGATTPDGRYELAVGAPVQPLPQWLVAALTHAPPADTPVTTSLPDAYLRAALSDEARRVREAQPGTRRLALVRAAARMGRLTRLDEQTIAGTLRQAAAQHIADGAYTVIERERAISDGITWGRDHPRHIISPPQSGDGGG
ncbi:bifunctional DNA primase/polymerase [Actinosynnema sp. NPDC023587]|uniref:bifunctional DNA primase/polymerase n=1 Tax=Actinosynnema sp. NPDC023587 TaxID=3154695 RepID=UPI0033F52367